MDLTNGILLNKGNSKFNGAHTKKIFDKIASTVGLSVDGSDWLKQTLDPFPDYAQRIVGCPDEFQGKTVTRKAKKSVVIAKPASITTPTFDVIIFFSGNLYPARYTNGVDGISTRLCDYGSNGELVFPSTAADDYPVNTITGYCVPSGSPFFPNSPAWVEANADRFFSINFEEFVFDDRVRLLGGALELEDDTPDIYRGGNIRILDVPCSLDKNLVNTVRADFNFFRAQRQTIMFNAPPTNVAEATQYAGSVSWEAPDGCYAVLKQSKLDNPFRPPCAASPIYSAGLDMQSNNTAAVVHYPCVSSSGIWLVRNTTDANLPKVLDMNGPAVLPAPFDMKVVILTGLQPQARFTLFANMIFETLPSSEDMKELALATPSPQWDPRALELYSHIVNELPPAVPFADNADGSWFQKVSSALRDYAPSIGAALGTVIPGAGAIGNLLGKAGGMAYDNSGAISDAFSKMKVQSQKRLENTAKQKAENPKKPKAKKAAVKKQNKAKAQKV